MSKTVWLITGAGRGMGTDIAKAALAAGHAVVATGRDPERVAAAIGAHDDLLAVKLDVTSPDDAKAAAQAAVDRFGRVDVLVNNAGNFIAGFFEEISPGDFRAQVETNLFGPLNVTRAVLPVMRQQRSGLVIAITSTGGIAGQEFCSAYSASKFGLEGWIESLAPEVAPFGIRTIRFDAQNGFFLNGRHVEVNGVCNHADLGALGTAINTRALQRQVEIMKEMGANAIRTSHNPPAPELLTLCDKLGMLVMDESFDCWATGKNAHDYHTLFADWHAKDLRNQVRRDRNHPCVILWSIGNEIPEQGWGAKMAKDLADIVHSEDLTRPVTAACDQVYAGTNGFQKSLDILGYNYKYGSYESFHAKNPDEPVFGSETASTISSRGEYFFPPGGDKQDFQVSSYDLSAPGWASPPDPELKAEAKFPFVFGQFLWTGFDYLGEPTPYNNDKTNLLNFSDPAMKAKMAEEMQQLGKVPVPSRSSYFGAVDLAGFKKDLFYLMQAAWRPDYPMAHILPHWNWPERVGKVTPVFVYTSGDEAELFLNGQSLGRKQKNGEFRLKWNDVVYQPGELKVVAYKNGQKWAEDAVKTTGDAAKLLMTPDRATIKADGQDLSFVTVAIADKDGLTVPRTHNAISFELTGPGEIVATDNGDATSLVSFQSKERQAFNGLALVIVRTQAGQPGDIVLKAKSDGLEAAEVHLTSQ